MKLNWRYIAATAYLRARGSRILKELKLLRRLERASPEEIRALRDQRLTDLLIHAWRHTEYYREVLADCGVVVDGKVHLHRFSQLPLLTKDVLLREQSRLRARETAPGRKPFRNSSGGTTGQPTVFWQDSFYWDMVIASKLYTFEMLGKRLGEPEMKIWGSERDLSEGTIGWKARLQNFLYNRDFQQCFHLPSARVDEIVRRINQIRPKLIWSYRDGIDVVAGHILRKGLEVHSPTAIVAGGATLYPHIVKTVEAAFQAPLVNYYGSREFGGVACQCLEREGLHIASYASVVEVVDERARPVVDREGELAITSLHNYTMPLIRYQIGDRGTMSSRTCACGRGFPMLESISGRIVERFVNARGDTVDPIYFIRMIRLLYPPAYLQRFQMVQERTDHIRVNMILEEGASSSDVRAKLPRFTEAVRLVMGEECEVKYEFVSEIPLTASGKHQYIVCRVPADQTPDASRTAGSDDARAAPGEDRDAGHALPVDQGVTADPGARS